LKEQGVPLSTHGFLPQQRLTRDDEEAASVRPPAVAFRIDGCLVAQLMEWVLVVAGSRQSKRIKKTKETRKV
jgi:hypothetical protein